MRELTFEGLVEAWPGVLGRLEEISRSSWMVATASRPVAVAFKDGDPVVTLEFASPADLTKFKPKPQGSGAFLDVRRAIEELFGRQVKFLTRLGEPGGEGPGAGPGEPGTPGSAGPSSPAASRAGDPAPRAAGPTAPARSAPDTPGAENPAPPAAAPSAPPRAAAAAPARAAAAAPVTDWAVAPIPSDADAPPPDPGPAAVPVDTSAQFAVDDEPEDAVADARTRTATLAPPREGEVLPREDVAPSSDPDDDDVSDDVLDTTEAIDAPLPPTVAPPLVPRVSTRNDGVQRYGEAVIRQVLGATFVREEPYEPPTRFS